MILLILFSFLAGIVTVLSPCILPLLPIILSSADGTKKHKPVGVVIGFIASFTFFTLFLSSIVRLSGISADSLRILSIVVLAGFGISLLIPQIQTQIEVLFSRFANLVPSSQKNAGFAGGFLIGLSLGLLWTPCVGPILASVISLAITGTVTAQAFLITMAYATGTAIPMFIIMYAGSTALQRVPWLLKNTANIQKAFGIFMVLTALGIFFNVDRRFQTYIISTFPNYGVGLTKFETIEEVRTQLQQTTQQSKSDEESILQKTMSELSRRSGPRAPELVQGGQWFNSQPLQLRDLRGKVVLVDFWTYSCINCQRTLPYIRTWWNKYQDKGLIIIGVHSPEFEFEKDPRNVSKALSDFEIKYPVMQDNQFETWKAYNNHYWPAKYLIDKDGIIRYTHFGEGKYDETEKKIQELLNESGDQVSTEPIANPSYKTFARTPELYLGSERLEYLASPEQFSQNQPTVFTAPKKLLDDTFAFQGEWTIQPEYAAPKKNAVLHLNFEAKEVFLVARSKNGQVGKMKVSLDGTQQSFGLDNENGIIQVNQDKLYNLIRLSSPGRHDLQIEFLDDSIEIYAFTFG